jgi:transposase-like protein
VGFTGFVACIKDARAIYNARNRKEALEAYFARAGKWRPVSEKAVRCMERDLEDLLNFYLCPELMRIKLRTTNVLERAFREVRRRILPMSCFNNSQSIERIIYAVLKSFK